MSWLELRIPPPLVALIVVAAMWGVSTWAPLMPAESLRRMMAVVIVATALAIELAGVLAFRRSRTTINPMAPDRSSTLVTTGIYRLTRNPMYVGLTMTLIGLALWWGGAWALVGPVAFVAYLTRFQIVPEERVLAAKFGTAFDEYRGRVRRWL
jgi:protein-S-isoprenylcysteine O-methyltransferase Ste14